ncbi:MAG: phytanoyl-CoA dioxygenase family protein [Candidatus Latescibacterota bacterium]|nr:phytanoyl-CoA dioxygenase family protein [Candidatus Latescibacterota bacterium]
MPELTQPQIDSFIHDGYLVIEEAFPPKDLAPLISEFSASVDRNASTAQRAGLITNRCEDAPFETRLASILASAPVREMADAPNSVLYEGIRGKLKSPAMFGIMTHPGLLDIVESLIGPEILAHPQFNVRAKLPNQDRSVVPWHQDLGYLELEAEDTFMVNFWLPLIDATNENGCLEVIPGSHHTYINHVEGLGPAGNFKGVADNELPLGEPVCCPVPKGGVLLIQHRTIHRSVPNITNQVRWSLDLRYSDPALPTGRADTPGFIARSKQDPGKVALSLEDWIAQSSSQ